MNIKSHKPLRKHIRLIRENAKQAKGYLEQGKISKEDLNLFKVVDTAEDAMKYILSKLEENKPNF